MKEFPVADNVKNEKKPKIVYMGFRTFESKVTGSSGRSTSYTAELNYGKRTIPKLESGVFIDQLKSNGFRSDVSSDQVKAFIADYLGEVKVSGSKELSYLIEVEKINGNSVFKLRNFPVNYYVMGIHGPAFAKASNVGIEILYGISTLFSIVTLGLIPSYSSEIAKTEVKIYDKNLKLVNKLEYDNSYSFVSAVWIFPNPGHCTLLKCLPEKVSSPPDYIYSGMGPRIEEDVLRVVQNSPTN
ncbi:hypothetical protein LEP1GSC193_4076 [Leptospira alstonii serovar Pingchang str. 80-412]|uniref:Uncharacterized protein n=3 Tax=Leptospira alstonii TaxID=28452 RepID=M6CF74_9LEPT|nr:hypothetical protein [Leptospira alstonii]EMJ90512.1 hypothetical protein LEP1GSC194_1154 [Leptospira alstonii serovar Sichuan str. 79601]EQA80439.1 hypothetical protein LEP1GSC193_4076 [Leptospira alstonii serovar Pingchang str. 80-412]